MEGFTIQQRRVVQEVPSNEEGVLHRHPEGQLILHSGQPAVVKAGVVHPQ
jgi:hypothetical protein